MKEPPLLEVIAASVADARLAESSGADRLELVQALSEGGLTPSPGLVHAVVAAVRIPVMVMVRTRGGDFVWSTEEMAVMLHDLAVLKTLGIAGVVFGALRADATLDREALERVVAAARPLQVTFHRAFDAAVEPTRALETLIASGVDRVLTSGQQPDADRGSSLLAELVTRAGDRITVMPGAGITPANAARIAATTKAREFHASCSSLRPDGQRCVDADKVRAVRAAFAYLPGGASRDAR